MVWKFKDMWRPGPESNRRPRICSPLHNHSATRPHKYVVILDANNPYRQDIR